MTNEEAKELLRRYRLGECSEEESRTIEEWYASLENNSDWEWSEEDKKAFKSILRNRIMSEVARERTKINAARKIRMRWQVAAAAVVFAIASIVAYAYFSGVKNSRLLHRPQAEIRYLPFTMLCREKPEPSLPWTMGQKFPWTAHEMAGLLLRALPVY